MSHDTRDTKEPLDVPALLDEVERLKGCVEEARQQGRRAGRREALEEAAQVCEEEAARLEYEPSSEGQADLSSALRCSNAILQMIHE